MNSPDLPTEDRRDDHAKCDAFEAAWVAGMHPRIEDFLESGEAATHSGLLAELLMIELKQRRVFGQSAGEEGFVERFPEKAEIVQSVFAKLALVPLSERGIRPRSPAANVLYALLALQGGLIRRADLIESVEQWVRDKKRCLVDLLIERNALSPDDRTLMDALFARYLSRHAGDVDAGLANLSSIGSVRAESERIP